LTLLRCSHLFFFKKGSVTNAEEALNETVKATGKVASQERIEMIRASDAGKI
jgi:hypothetical protein